MWDSHPCGTSWLAEYQHPDAGCRSGSQCALRLPSRAGALRGPCAGGTSPDGRRGLRQGEVACSEDNSVGHDASILHLALGVAVQDPVVADVAKIASP